MKGVESTKLTKQISITKQMLNEAFYDGLFFPSGAQVLDSKQLIAHQLERLIKAAERMRDDLLTI